MAKLRVAMIAPPWLAVPPAGYGGIENVLNALVPELERQGIEVELFATGDSTVKVKKLHSIYPNGQYEHIHSPIYVAGSIAAAQIMFALNQIKAAGNFDIIHDHNGYFGPLAMARLGADFPPTLHTLHGPPFSTKQRISKEMPDNLPFWRQLGQAENFYLVGISEALMRSAPKELRRIILPAVHNAVALDDFPFVKDKDDYFITLARFHPEKGQALAVRLARELDVKLKMAGVVADMTDPKRVLLELINPLSNYRSLADFRYYSDDIFPYLSRDHIEFVGEVSGERKLKFISRAKALLFPINWDEPFGMAPIEALSCGTPVVAMRRGALPEIIEHGVNGFLADTPAQFKAYMQRTDEIDPAACRASVEAKFSAQVMAKAYIDRYHQILALSKSN